MGKQEVTGASASADQALVASDQAASRLAPLGFDPSRGLYTYAVMVSRHGPSMGQIATSVVQGYRIANNEDEVRGMAVAYTVGAKPDFSIDQVLVLRVGDDAVAQAHAIAMEAQRGGTPKSDPTAEGGDSAGPKDIAQGGSHDSTT